MEDAGQKMWAGGNSHLHGKMIAKNIKCSKGGSNSYTDSHSGGFDIGAARTLENSRGKLVFAPIMDYGTGSYDSYFNNGMHGKGNNKYWALGMIARA